MGPFEYYNIDSSRSVSRNYIAFRKSYGKVIRFKIIATNITAVINLFVLIRSCLCSLSSNTFHVIHYRTQTYLLYTHRCVRICVLVVRTCYKISESYFDSMSYLDNRSECSHVLNNVNENIERNIAAQATPYVLTMSFQRIRPTTTDQHTIQWLKIYILQIPGTYIPCDPKSPFTVR